MASVKDGSPTGRALSSEVKECLHIPAAAEKHHPLWEPAFPPDLVLSGKTLTDPSRGVALLTS